MPDLLDRLEVARRTLAMRQAEVADSLAITQGHYSKVVRRLATPGPALSERIEQWLAMAAPGVDPPGDEDVRIAELATSIRDQVVTLLSLLGARRSARKP